MSKLKRIIKGITPEQVVDSLIYLRGGWGANPYLPYNDESKSIFIHIPKTAGISVKIALFGGIKRDHISLKYFEAYDQRKFNTYFKFAIVRNPYDRLVSAFFYIKKGRDGYSKQLALFPDFTSFVFGLQYGQIRKEIFRIPHFMPQTYFLKNRKQQIGVDFLGRFENLDADFLYITKRLEINAILKHRNKSVHITYTDYYNDNTRDIVARIYHEDFALLGY